MYMYKAYTYIHTFTYKRINISDTKDSDRSRGGRLSEAAMLLRNFKMVRHFRTG